MDGELLDRAREELASEAVRKLEKWLENPHLVGFDAALAAYQYLHARREAEIRLKQLLAKIEAARQIQEQTYGPEFLTLEGLDKNLGPR